MKTCRKWRPQSSSERKIEGVVVGVVVEKVLAAVMVVVLIEKRMNATTREREPIVTPTKAAVRGLTAIKLVAIAMAWLVTIFVAIQLAIFVTIRLATTALLTAKTEAHYVTKLGNFETSKIYFPTSEGVSEVSERASERVSAAEGASEASSPEQVNE